MMPDFLIFFLHIVKLWNLLPTYVEYIALNNFKRCLRDYFFERFRCTGNRNKKTSQEALNNDEKFE